MIATSLGFYFEASAYPFLNAGSSPAERRKQGLLWLIRPIRATHRIPHSADELQHVDLEEPAELDGALGIEDVLRLAGLEARVVSARHT